MLCSVTWIRQGKKLAYRAYRLLIYIYTYIKTFIQETRNIDWYNSITEIWRKDAFVEHEDLIDIDIDIPDG